jgi:hypothetical protein
MNITSKFSNLGISITINILDTINRPGSYLKHNVSQTGFSLRLQVSSTQLDPLNRATPHWRQGLPLWTDPNGVATI